MGDPTVSPKAEAARAELEMALLEAKQVNDRLLEQFETLQHQSDRGPEGGYGGGGWDEVGPMVDPEAAEEEVLEAMRRAAEERQAREL